MTFRVRLFLAFLVVVAVPLVIMAAGVRREVTVRITTQYEERVSALARIIEADITLTGDRVAARIAALARTLPDDNRFRLAAVQRLPAERAYLIDWAGRAMALAGLDMLQLHDSTGRILSSGQFRADFDRLDPGLILGLIAAQGAALQEAQTAEGSFLVLARIDSVMVGGARFNIAGGIRVDQAMLDGLARDPELSIGLELPSGENAAHSDRPITHTDRAVVRQIALPFVHADGQLNEAQIVLAHSLQPLRRLERNVNFWFLAALLITAVTASLVAAWLALWMSRPIRDLAAASEQIDLDHPELDFTSDRADEIGMLALVLGRMTARLRTDAARLREVERRATLGELARQVNHDVKNGLAPLRNVFRHLAEVAEQKPADLPRVFAERRETIDSGIAYLEQLATSYAKLTPTIHAQPCDLNATVRDVTSAIDGSVALDLSPHLPAVLADPLALRRILENVIRNAIESLDGPTGGVRVGTSADRQTARIVVSDTGRGMSQEELDRAFQPFQSTKPGGTGLGLPIVRRLAADMGGTLKVETAPGKGTTLTIQLPATGGAPQ